MSNITAKLMAARRVETPLGTVLSGMVFGDSKGRFDSGTHITTSPIVLEEGDIVHTKYSCYEVTWSVSRPSLDKSGQAGDAREP
jgi:hypothetical protein